MTKEWKGSAKPSFKIRPIRVEAPDWFILLAWFSLAVNIASFLLNAVAGSFVWAFLGLAGGIWLAYWLWSYYQTRKA